MPDPDDDILRDITGPETLPESPFPNEAWFWLLLVVAVIVISMIAVLFWRTPKKRRKTAGQRALEQLDRLQSLQLLNKNQAEKHFTLLAGILRRYLEKAYCLSSLRVTTPELLAAASRNTPLQKHLPFLESFLTRCDVAKFAPPVALQGLDSSLDGELRAWLLAQEADSKSRPSLDAPAAASKMSDS